MGIRGFGPTINGRYGVIAQLGDAVVVDGPSLVHQILEGCISRRPATYTGFICYPSYSKIGDLVVGWLEELRRHNVTIRKIYFDGYLPPVKWQVRQQRLMNQSQNMTDLLMLHPDGSSRAPGDVFERLRPRLSITNKYYNLPYRWLPKPPFLIPAVVDILRNSRTWGPLVEIVAGEADMFLAEDVRRNGGTILTGDSDLLITDLGPDGSASFFTDVAAVDPFDGSQGVKTRRFSLRAANELSGLSEVGGLACVAFYMSVTGTKLKQALETAKNGGLQYILDSPDYIAFTEELSGKEYLPADHPIHSVLSGLDPRISEIIIQTVLFDGDEASATGGQSKELRGPQTLAMFLPIMIEKRDRKSTWTMSTIIRQLAYSVMQSFASKSSAFVIEFRVLNTSSSLLGRKIHMLESDEAIEQCSLLVDTLKQLTERLASVDMLWLAFAIHQDITWSKSEERPPLSLSLIEKASDSPYIHSWDIIHFAAQAQASLYSLRMAKQALDVAVALGQTQPAPMLELREQLSSLPPITEWPTVDNMPGLLAAAAAAGEANVLSAIADMLNDPTIKEVKSVQERYTRKRKNRDERPVRKQDPEWKRSSNPFAALSEDGWR